MIQGRVWLMSDNIDTDAIIPGRFLVDWNKEPEALGRYCFVDLDPSFSQKVRSGDILVAGHNFGCGSSRQAAPVALKAAGISCVIAKSFARIFFRNAVNIGLPVLECPALISGVKEGDLLEVSIEQGTILNTRSGCRFEFEPFPQVVLSILQRGGLANYVQAKLAGRKTENE